MQNDSYKAMETAKLSGIFHFLNIIIYQEMKLILLPLGNLRVSDSILRPIRILQRMILLKTGLKPRRIQIKF